MEFGSSVPPTGMGATLQMRSQIIPLPTRRPVEEDLSPLALRDPNRRFERAMQERDRLNGRDPLELRDPSRPLDPSKRGLENGAAPAPWSLEAANGRRKDEGRSLSPITEFGWEARDPSRRSIDAGQTGRKATTDREKPADRSPFDVTESSARDSYQPSSPFEIFSARPKEKPTLQQLERRANFEKLLNPSADPLANKGPGSLEPVGSGPTPPTALNMPTLARTAVPNSPPVDPTVAYNRQSERWNGPVFDDAYKKYAPKPSSAPAPAPTATSYQAPLNRQPIAHEFPSRRF